MDHKHHLIRFVHCPGISGLASFAAYDYTGGVDDCPELDTVGYNLFRSTNPNEEGTRVNEELIPASPDPLTGGAYQFEDQDVQAGMKYYFSLEEVENTGMTNRAGTIEVTAKQSGWWEIGLAALLLGSVVVGVFNLADSYRNKSV